MSRTYKNLPYKVAFEMVSGRPEYEDVTSSFTIDELMDLLRRGYTFSPQGDKSMVVGKQFFNSITIENTYLLDITLVNSSVSYLGRMIFPFSDERGTHREDIYPLVKESWNNWFSSYFYVGWSGKRVENVEDPYGEYVHIDLSSSTYTDIDMVSSIYFSVYGKKMKTNKCHHDDLVESSFHSMPTKGGHVFLHSYTSYAVYNDKDKIEEINNYVYNRPFYTMMENMDPSEKSRRRVVPIVVIDVYRIPDKDKYTIKSTFHNRVSRRQLVDIHRYSFGNWGIQGKSKKEIERALKRKSKTAERTKLNRARDLYNSGVDLDEEDIIIEDPQDSRWFLD